MNRRLNVEDNLDPEVLEHEQDLAWQERAVAERRLKQIRRFRQNADLGPVVSWLANFALGIVLAFGLLFLFGVLDARDAEPFPAAIATSSAVADAGARK